MPVSGSATASPQKTGSPRWSAATSPPRPLRRPEADPVGLVAPVPRDGQPDPGPARGGVDPRCASARGREDSMTTSAAASASRSSVLRRCVVTAACPAWRRSYTAGWPMRAPSGRSGVSTFTTVAPARPRRCAQRARPTWPTGRRRGSRRSLRAHGPGWRAPPVRRSPAPRRARRTGCRGGRRPRASAQRADWAGRQRGRPRRVLARVMRARAVDVREERGHGLDVFRPGEGQGEPSVGAAQQAGGPTHRCPPAPAPARPGRTVGQELVRVDGHPDRGRERRAQRVEPVDQRRRGLRWGTVGPPAQLGHSRRRPSIARRRAVGIALRRAHVVAQGRCRGEVAEQPRGEALGHGRTVPGGGRAVRRLRSGGCQRGG